MKRFVLQCEHGDFRTPTILDVTDLEGDDTTRLRSATLELATHVHVAHGLTADVPWTFTALEVQEGGGDIWATEVVGERP